MSLYRKHFNKTGIKLIACLIVLWSLCFLSCSDNEGISHYSADEAEKLARGIRRNSVMPDSWVMDRLDKADTVNLVDLRGYSGGLDVLKYLVPLLHSRGVRNLDLWFIPQDGLVQANALLKASLFFEQSAVDLMGRTGYLYLYEEHLDFLRYIYDFNHNLEEGEEGITLASLPAEGKKGVVYSSEPIEGIDTLLIQNPVLLGELEEEGEPHLISKMNQLFPLLKGNPPFFVLTADHFIWEKETNTPLLVIASPGSLNSCRPLKDGIDKDNWQMALTDFPEQVITAPRPLAIFFMERGQRRYLRGLD